MTTCASHRDSPVLEVIEEKYPSSKPLPPACPMIFSPTTQRPPTQSARVSGVIRLPSPPQALSRQCCSGELGCLRQPPDAVADDRHVGWVMSRAVRAAARIHRFEPFLTAFPAPHKIAVAAALKRGTSGALYPQSALAGLNSCPRSRQLRIPPLLRVLKAGPCAAECYEPRQVRKEAAVK